MKAVPRLQVTAIDPATGVTVPAVGETEPNARVLSTTPQVSATVALTVRLALAVPACAAPVQAVAMAAAARAHEARIAVLSMGRSRWRIAPLRCNLPSFSCIQQP